MAKAGKAKAIPRPTRTRSNSVSSNGSTSSASSSASSSSGSSNTPDAPVPKPLPTRNSNPTKYTAPKGMSAVNGGDVTSSVDWDTINNDPELELWAVRLPEGVKPRHLDGLTITLPDSNASTSSPADVLGSFVLKKATYELVLAGDSQRPPRTEGDGDEKPFVGSRGGEEMRALVPLLPRHSKGSKLFQAPRPITQHLLATRILPTSILSHLPSSASSLIASQPSPVPGAVLSPNDLLTPNSPAVLAKRHARAQPSNLRGMVVLGGMGGVKGGLGNFHNQPPTPKREVVVLMEKDAHEGSAHVKEDSPKKRRKSESPQKKKDAGSPKKKKVKVE